MGRWLDKIAGFLLPLAMPILVFFSALKQGNALSTILGVIAGGWLVINWIEAGHTAYVDRSEPQMIEDRDW